MNIETFSEARGRANSLGSHAVTLRQGARGWGRGIGVEPSRWKIMLSSASLRRGFLAPVNANLFDNLDSAKTPNNGCIVRHGKEDELPMSEDALRGWYWAGVIVSALVLWVIWYMVV
jgi:hypothetical protein